MCTLALHLFKGKHQSRDECCNIITALIFCVLKLLPSAVFVTFDISVKLFFCVCYLER